MELSVLGRTGLRVSRVGFGGIPIQRLTEVKAVDVVKGCLDLGINFIDTAHGYTTSEERIGKAIRGRRDGLVIASKTPARDAAGAREHLELSLRRLGTDRVDVYQLHGVSSPEQFEQVMGPKGAVEALVQAKQEGLIGHIGASSHSLSVAKMLIGCGAFETLQYPFNFIANEAEIELLPLVRQHDVGFIAMKPLGGGLISSVRVAFRYLLQFPEVVPDPGIQDIAEMAEILGYTRESSVLTEADLAEIEATREELGTTFCHRCEYCQPCTQGIAISTVLTIRSTIRRFPLERAFSPEITATVLKAQDCIECGDCESRCPYHLPIRDMLQGQVAPYLAEKGRYEADPVGYREAFGR